MPPSQAAQQQIVLLKRALRLSDHEPMRIALEDYSTLGPVTLLYIHEPDMIARPDFSALHSGYIQETLTDLTLRAGQIGASLVQAVGEPTDIFLAIHQHTPISRIVSYQESGHQASFERDIRVLLWCKAHGVQWKQLSQNGVHRGSALASKGFDFQARLQETADMVLWTAQAHPGWAPAALSSAWQLPDLPIPVGQGSDKPRRLPGGRARAEHQLSKFCTPEVLSAYPFSISSPIKAIKGCSHLSAALTYGVLSDREIIKAVNHCVEHHENILSRGAQAALHKGALAYAERLYWRASYLQCFETEVETETQAHIDTASLGISMSPALTEQSPEYIAWSQGKTGVPMIDASMRQLLSLGWINMRMRGMLACFAVGTLGIDWRTAGLHLAREFLDYEPGIHWNQMQIHSGISKLSSPLSYNPIKQAADHDPQGIYIKRWVSELRAVPLEFLAQPWKMNEETQKAAQCVLGTHYPHPIIDMKTFSKITRDRLYGPRKALASMNPNSPADEDVDPTF